MIGGKIIRLKLVDSTNLYLQQCIRKSEIVEGTIVIAEEQTDGKGQRENKWESAKGENLTFSFVLYPNFLKATDQFLISKIVSLSLVDLLKNYVKNVKIKWPNDIFIGKKKIAGVLIENVIKGASISSSVIGIGLNINQKEFSEELKSATSLYLETGKDFNIEDILIQLLDCLNGWYDKLKNEEIKDIHAQYEKALYQFNEFCSYSANNEIFNAKIIRVENDGRLCVTTDSNEIRKFAFKEIQFL